MAAEALEQSVLESKDKDQLFAIAKALGMKTSTTDEEGRHHRPDPGDDRLAVALPSTTAR